MHSKIYKCLGGLLLGGFFSLPSFAQETTKIDRVEPLNWWVGMQMHQIQLIIHGNNIAQFSPKIDYKGVNIVKVHKVENPNYLFLDIDISATAKSGTFPIVFQNGNQQLRYEYTLLPKSKSVKAQGVSSKDFIYLLMPDRFANGDPSNDRVAGLQDTALDVNVLSARHGGDLQGVIQHLDYIQNLGVTALWMTPALTNDELQTSYHGYANTENYHIDPRFGSNALFKALTDSLHSRGMKMVMDVVPNHFGDRHWTVLDLPMKDWVHQWPTFTKSNFRASAVLDPYASAADRNQMEKGWFDTHMPDMNEENPYVANYITQSNIWWIEYAGVDAFRIDTYPYNDPQFMADWAKKIKAEFPTFTMFGEVWVDGVSTTAAFQKGSAIRKDFNTELLGVTDFQMKNAITGAMTKSSSWDDGVIQIYNTLAKDFVYPDPSKNVVFLDNHDLSRFYSVVDQNQDKLKSALACLLTTRGIPQMYYGTELYMTGVTDPDGWVRQDVKGGWPGDKVNNFVASGRSQAQNELVDYIHTIAAYRKTHTVLQTGKLMQYIPEDGIYVYFRYDDQQTVMIVMNANGKPMDVDLARFSERIATHKQAQNIVSQAMVDLSSKLNIPAYSTQIFELK